MALSKNATIRQIADRANVSIATASRAINQPGAVKPETRSRVLRAMKDLGCQINRTDSKILLASFTDFVNPFYNQCISGMQAAATRRGYQLFLHQIENADSPSAYDFLLNNHIFQGFIFCHSVPSGEMLDNLRMKCPIVMCSQYNPSENIPYVVIDDYTSAKNAIRYLLSVGKKKLAFINSPLSFSYSALREKGYRDALTEAGLPIREDWIAYISDIDFDIAFSSAMALLEGPEIPDAIFCASDVFACAAVKAAHLRKLSVPSDVAVMGFDNVYLTTMTVPTISTVSQPTYQLGWQSCNLLIDQIEGVPTILPHIILETELIIREST